MIHSELEVLLWYSIGIFTNNISQDNQLQVDIERVTSKKSMNEVQIIIHNTMDISNI